MRTVLLIDDEPAVVSAMSQMFAAHDWDVVTASNGTKAVALAHERFVDVVVSDVIMEGLVGTALLDALRATRGAGQALFVLMSNMQEHRVRRLIPGDYVFIPKPFSFDHVMDVLGDELLQRSARGGARAAIGAEARSSAAR